MTDFEFKAKDFVSPGLFPGEPSRIHPQRAADRANAKLRAWLKKAPVVWRRVDGGWGEVRCPCADSNAYLVCVEKIGGEP